MRNQLLISFIEYFRRGMFDLLILKRFVKELMKIKIFRTLCRGGRVVLESAFASKKRIKQKHGKEK